MKEAIRTSVLSSRWRNLWTATTRLEFDDSMLVTKDEHRHIVRKAREEFGIDEYGRVVVVDDSMLVTKDEHRRVVRKVREEFGPDDARVAVLNDISVAMGLQRRIAETQLHRFIKSVNHILNSHQGSPIQEFELCCRYRLLDHSHQYHSHIDGWIKFALEKRVQKLFLNLQGLKYTLTGDFIGSCNLGSLVDLSLTGISMTSEVVEYIQSNSPCLEVLNVGSSPSLVCLRVSGPLIKQCSITDCFKLQSVDISAPNLVKFEYSGEKRISLSVKNAPRLVEVSVSGFYACFFLRNMDEFSECLSRLDILTLDLRERSISKITGFPELSNLKKVELQLKGFGVPNLRCFATLLDVAPLLQIFSVEISWLDDEEDRRHVRVRKIEPKPHRCLRLVQMHNFVGRANDFELALCLLKKALLLEKFVIYASKDEKKRISATTRGKHLEAYLPPGAEFLIL